MKTESPSRIFCTPMFRERKQQQQQQNKTHKHFDYCQMIWRWEWQPTTTVTMLMLVMMICIDIGISILCFNAFLWENTSPYLSTLYPLRVQCKHKYSADNPKAKKWKEQKHCIYTSKCQLLTPKSFGTARPTAAEAAGAESETESQLTKSNARRWWWGRSCPGKHHS